MNNKMNRLFTFLWISFAMMLTIVVGVIAVDVYSEDEAESVVSQGEKISKKKLRRIRQVKRSEPETRIAETRARMPEAVTEEEGDDEPPKTDAEVAYEEWEKLFDGLVKLQNEGKRPTTKQVADFKAAFDKLSDEVKLENIPHAQNLFTDASIEYLTVILFDTKEPKDVLSSIYYDLLNRPEELKMPIIRKLAADKSHPLSEEAFDLLVMVDDPAIKN